MPRMGEGESPCGADPTGTPPRSSWIPLPCLCPHLPASVFLCSWRPASTPLRREWRQALQLPCLHRWRHRSIWDLTGMEGQALSGSRDTFRGIIHSAERLAGLGGRTASRCLSCLLLSFPGFSWGQSINKSLAHEFGLGLQA